MAWRAKVASKRPDQLAGVLRVDIDFYDDADPATMLARRTLDLPSGVSAQEVQTLVRAEGARERAKHAELAVLDAMIAVGAEISV